MTKSDLDAFRRDLEQLIGEPGDWWFLWARIERDVLREDQ
jgi:hypothetical protein